MNEISNIDQLKNRRAARLTNAAIILLNSYTTAPVTFKIIIQTPKFIAFGLYDAAQKGQSQLHKSIIQRKINRFMTDIKQTIDKNSYTQHEDKYRVPYLVLSPNTLIKALNDLAKTLKIDTENPNSDFVKNLNGAKADTALLDQIPKTAQPRPI